MDLSYLPERRRLIALAGKVASTDHSRSVLCYIGWQDDLDGWVATDSYHFGVVVPSSSPEDEPRPPDGMMVPADRLAKLLRSTVAADRVTLEFDRTEFPREPLQNGYTPSPDVVYRTTVIVEHGKGLPGTTTTVLETRETMSHMPSIAKLVESFKPREPDEPPVALNPRYLQNIAELHHWGGSPCPVQHFASGLKIVLVRTPAGRLLGGLMPMRTDHLTTR